MNGNSQDAFRPIQHIHSVAVTDLTTAKTLIAPVRANVVTLGNIANGSGRQQLANWTDSATAYLDALTAASEYSATFATELAALERSADAVAD